MKRRKKGYSGPHDLSFVIQNDAPVDKNQSLIRRCFRLSSVSSRTEMQNPRVDEGICVKWMLERRFIWRCKKIELYHVHEKRSRSYNKHYLKG